MDWREETVFGNMAQRFLGEIVHSESYRTLLFQVAGKVGSKRDSTCKRCEWAMVEPEPSRSATVGSEEPEPRELPESQEVDRRQQLARMKGR